MYAYQFCVHLRISTTISDVIYIFVAVVLYAASTPKSLSEVSYKSPGVSQQLRSLLSGGCDDVGVVVIAQILGWCFGLRFRV